MSGQMNIIWVSLPNQFKQNKLKTVYMWSCCYKTGCHPIGVGVGGRRCVYVCVCVYVCEGVGVEVEAPPVLQKSYTIFMSLLLVNLLLSPVALNHCNKITIGFVIHKNLQNMYMIFLT